MMESNPLGEGRLFLKLVFPIGMLPGRTHPEDVVRAVVDANNAALTQALTAGSMTVNIAQDGRAIDVFDAMSGAVEFVIGGKSDLTEAAHFKIDWGHRTIELRVRE
ncbi:hypothetical protein BH09VER1_BH09VER1_11670 [soil metagenome]